MKGQKDLVFNVLICLLSVCLHVQRELDNLWRIKDTGSKQPQCLKKKKSADKFNFIIIYLPKFHCPKKQSVFLTFSIR